MKAHWPAGFALAFTWAVSLPTADGAIRRTVDVTYERASWGDESEPVTREVTFATGRELNRKTRTFDYEMFSNYALLWFAEDEVAIVKLDTFIYGVGEEFEADDFKKAFRFTTEVKGNQVNSDREREWHFRAKRGLRWIDPRVQGY